LLFSLLDQIQVDPYQALVSSGGFLVALLFALTIHEFSHALAATRLGDPTPGSLGRLSLSPLAHLDPFGTLMLLLAGFGWAKPVPIDPSQLRIGPRSGMAVVALAGPLSNIAAAAIFAIPINGGIGDPGLFGQLTFPGGSVVGYLLLTAVFWNLLLASFNLVPLVPLDGYKAALGMLPREAGLEYAKLEKYGSGPLMIVIMIGFAVPGMGLFSLVLNPLIRILGSLVLW
jgi:Zn-dependent protease